MQDKKFASKGVNGMNTEVLNLNILVWFHEKNSVKINKRLGIDFLATFNAQSQ